MITRVILLASLVGCGGETGFQSGTGDNATTDATGKMEVYPSELVWTDLSVGIAESQYLKITSTGDEPLRVYDISVVSSAQGQFYMEPVDEFELEKGHSQEFSVKCTLAALEEAVGELRIKSSDPDQLDLRLTLTADPAASGDTADTGGDSGT